jgi:hypothetical protein
MKCGRLLAITALAGCVHLRPPPPASSVGATAAWAPAISAAQRDASAGRHDDAERVLRDFAAAYPGTVEGLESAYWRAMILLDPSNGKSSPREAAALLGEYLEAEAPVVHRAEALVLRRLATTLAAARDTPARAAVTDPRDGEIKRLKEELEKTTAELDRIKKRLSPPSAGTPPPTPPSGA